MPLRHDHANRICRARASCSFARAVALGFAFATLAQPLRFCNWVWQSQVPGSNSTSCSTVWVRAGPVVLAHRTPLGHATWLPWFVMRQRVRWLAQICSCQLPSDSRGVARCSFGSSNCASVHIVFEDRCGFPLLGFKRQKVPQRTEPPTFLSSGACHFVGVAEPSAKLEQFFV